MLQWIYLQVVIDYFNSRLDSLNSHSGAAPEGHSEWSVDRVLEMVQTLTQVGWATRQRTVQTTLDLRAQ